MTSCGTVLSGKLETGRAIGGTCQRPKLCYFRLPGNFCYIISRSGWMMEATAVSVLQEDPDLYWTVKVEIWALGLCLSRKSCTAE